MTGTPVPTPPTGRGTKAARPRPRWRPLAGLVLGVLAAPLLIVLPEAGLPLAYVALRLLASRFAWASRADDALRRLSGKVHAWFVALPRAGKLLLSATALLAAGAAVWRTADSLA
ncbi:hypothetical protein ACQP2F_13940 [Actinoplanes sp. CA-030573]|uniref:hypothetical protein n=1 Tax=Actinoplanes sp. CA-030573 TaxID=3239898 RepID=UPI003D8DF372